MNADPLTAMASAQREHAGWRHVVDLSGPHDQYDMPYKHGPHRWASLDDAQHWCNGRRNTTEEDR